MNFSRYEKASQVAFKKKKKKPANKRDTGSIPQLGRSPGKGNGNLLHGQKSLENPMGRRAWWAAAAAASKSLQSCLTLCDPIDGSPRGSPVPGVLQARTLEATSQQLNISKTNTDLEAS